MTSSLTANTVDECGQHVSATRTAAPLWMWKLWAALSRHDGLYNHAEELRDSGVTSPPLGRGLRLVQG